MNIHRLTEQLSAVLSGAYLTTSKNLYLGYDYVMKRLFGPREVLDRHLIALSYYYQGKWHMALVKHINRRSRVMSVKGIYDLVDMDPVIIDVTDLLKLILGPAEDCSGQDVYPEDVGVSSLKFELLTENYSTTKIIEVKTGESIREKLSIC